MSEESRVAKKFPRLLGVIALILFLPYILIYLIFHFLYGLILHVLIWVFWIPRGKSMLVVTSESPIWQDYMDEDIISILQPRAMILNWSERSEWSHAYDLRVLCFYYFGGKSEFNPLVIVFRPFRRAKVFRFWSAFKEYRHGKDQALEEITHELLKYVGANKRKDA